MNLFNAGASMLRSAHVACRWLFILLPLTAIVGSLCALFLWLLDVVTDWRFGHPGVLWLLPLGGVMVGLLYHWWGRIAEGGNNLIVDQIHEPGGGVPLRMAPLVLIGTVASHLFGASVGREGTAVQIGGSVAGGLGKLYRLPTDQFRLVLICGIAAGFGAVFGTPIAGAIFALEVLCFGKMEYRALVPAAASAILADFFCHLWGINHVAYRVAYLAGHDRGSISFHTDPLLLGKIVLASVCFGLVSLLFAESVHRLAPVCRKICPIPWLRPAVGGVVTIVLVSIAGSRDYLGLGVISPDVGGASIVNFFHDGAGTFTWAWLWKLVFTVAALATGFKGGEVTPLFFIGAGLGNTLAGVLGVPVDLLASVGFVAVFAGAANTPLACTLMGVELFGGGNIVYIATGCFVAYLCSGHSGIYLSQRVGVPKSEHRLVVAGMVLRDARKSIGKR